MMEDLEIKEAKKWIEVWKQANNSLEALRIEELRSSDYYAKNRSLLNEMLKYAFEHRTVRLTSGLIEQQLIFMKYLHKER